MVDSKNLNGGISLQKPIDYTIITDYKFPHIAGWKFRHNPSRFWELIESGHSRFDH